MPFGDIESSYNLQPSLDRAATLSAHCRSDSFRERSWRPYDIAVLHCPYRKQNRPTLTNCTAKTRHSSREIIRPALFKRDLPRGSGVDHLDKGREFWAGGCPALGAGDFCWEAEHDVCT